MVATPHAIAGLVAARQSKVQGKRQAGAVGVISHFVLDRIPHADYSIRGFRGKLLVSLDLWIAQRLVRRYARTEEELAAAAAAVGVDIWVFAESKIGASVFTPIHTANHTARQPRRSIGIFTQVALLGSSLWLLERQKIELEAVEAYQTGLHAPGSPETLAVSVATVSVIEEPEEEPRKKVETDRRVPQTGLVMHDDVQVEDISVEEAKRLIAVIPPPVPIPAPPFQFITEPEQVSAVGESPREEPAEVPVPEETPLEEPIPEELPGEPVEAPTPAEEPLKEPIPEELPVAPPEELPAPQVPDEPVELPTPTQTPLEEPSPASVPEPIDNPIAEPAPVELPHESPAELPSISPDETPSQPDTVVAKKKGFMDEDFGWED